ncbi:MAG: NAD(P)-binding domain-containing protein [Chloroflexota bacterium]
MKISVIGAGKVGGNLGAGWVKSGHEVLYGVRDPNSEKTRKTLSTSSSAKVGTLAEAAAFGDVVVLTVPWVAARETIAALGNLSGKIVIDAMNAFAPPAVEHGSVGQDVAAMAAGARVVKAFNTMGEETMANPDFKGQRATAFVCGDDADAKAVVIQLAKDLGLDAYDAGALTNAVYAEGMTKIWASLARGGLGRDIAFKLIKR